MSGAAQTGTGCFASFTSMPVHPIYRVIAVEIRPEGVGITFADRTCAIFPESLLYSSRNLALMMSGVRCEDTEELKRVDRRIG